MLWITALVAFFLLLMAFDALGEASMVRSRLIRQCLHHTREFVNEPARTVSLSEEGLTYATPSTSTLLRWDRFVDSIVETPEHIFICLLPSGAAIVPKRSFASTATATDFARTARGHLARAGGPAYARAFLGYLADHDAPCPRCAYNLRAITTPRCPECGLQILAEDFPGFGGLKGSSSVEGSAE